jgi:hypothetical protein
MHIYMHTCIHMYVYARVESHPSSAKLPDQFWKCSRKPFMAELLPTLRRCSSRHVDHVGHVDVDEDVNDTFINFKHISQASRGRRSDPMLKCSDTEVSKYSDIQGLKYLHSTPLAPASPFVTLPSLIHPPSFLPSLPPSLHT